MGLLRCHLTNPLELHDEEEVYLCKQGKQIFQGKFQKTSAGSTVHGVELSDDSGRFLITEVLKNAKTWKGFDIDKTCNGAAIMWKLKTIQRIKRKAEMGTEALRAAPLAKKKRKRNPDQWQKNLRKKSMENSERGREILPKKNN